MKDLLRILIGLKTKSGNCVIFDKQQYKIRINLIATLYTVYRIHLALNKKLITTPHIFMQTHIFMHLINKIEPR